MSIETTIQENTETMRLLIAKFQSLTEALSNQPAVLATQAPAAPKAEKPKAPKADPKPETPAAPKAEEPATQAPAAPKAEKPKAPAADISAEIKAKASALLKAGRMPQLKAALSAAGVSTVTDACRLEPSKTQAFLSALEALELE